LCSTTIGHREIEGGGVEPLERRLDSVPAQGGHRDIVAQETRIRALPPIPLAGYAAAVR
jgi:hypothetical protein